MKLYCIICRNEFLPSSEIMSADCGHIFHDTCIYRWFNEYGSSAGTVTCPVCRSMILREFMVTIIHMEGTPLEEMEDDPSVLRARIEDLQEESTTICFERDRLKWALVRTENQMSKLEEDLMQRNATIWALKEQIMGGKVREMVTEASMELQRCTERLEALKQLLASQKPVLDGSLDDPEVDSNWHVFNRNPNSQERPEELDAVVDATKASASRAQDLLHEALSVASIPQKKMGFFCKLLAKFGKK